MKKLLIAVTLIIIVFIKIMTASVLKSNGTISDGAIYGFDVDSCGNYYIGKWKKIEVYQESSLVRTIPIRTTRVYCFVIEDDFLNIGYSTSSQKGEVFDLNGEKIGDSVYNFNELHAMAEHNKLIKKAGHEFEIKRYLGLKPYEILCDGKVVHRMSMLDYLFNCFPDKLFYVISFFSVAILVLSCLTDDAFKRTFGIR